jgi:hypothetical protein
MILLCLKNERKVLKNFTCMKSKFKYFIWITIYVNLWNISKIIQYKLYYLMDNININIYQKL